MELRRLKTDKIFHASILAVFLLSVSSANGDDAHEDAAKDLFSAGFSALKADRAAEAESEFLAGLKIRQDAQAEYFLGEAQRRLGKFQLAIESYRKSLSLQPKGSTAELATSKISVVQSILSAQKLDNSTSPRPSVSQKSIPSPSGLSTSSDGPREMVAHQWSHIDESNSYGETNKSSYTISFQHDGTLVLRSTVAFSSESWTPVRAAGCPNGTKSATQISDSTYRYSYNPSDSTLVGSIVGTPTIVYANPVCFSPRTGRTELRMRWDGAALVDPDSKKWASIQ